MTKIGSLLAVVLVLASSAVARADSATTCDDDPAPQKIRFHVEMVDGHPRTVIDTKIVVCQKLPRPSVLYILEAHHVSYIWQNLELAHFIPRVLETVSSSPF